MPGKCTFNDLWLRNPKYEDWISKVNSNVHVVRCILCMKNFDVSSMGESALKSHMMGKRHISLYDARKKNTTIGSMLIQKMPEPAAVSTSSLSQTTIQVSKTDTLKAEIIWALKVMKSHFSYRSCTDIEKIFKLMFSDSEIVSNFSCGEKKCAYICCFGLAPHFKSLLLQDIKDDNKDVVILFDESLNKFTQSKQLDVHIRMWKNQKVITRYLTSIFLGHATADIIFEKLHESLENLPLKNILQLSMDGPKVNWKVFKIFEDRLSAEGDMTLLNIGSCGLHIVHNCFRKGFSSSDWGIDSFLMSLFRLFKDSPARREDFGETKMPLKFCMHRWVENSLVCERAIEIWPSVISYVSNVTKKLVTDPSNLSYETVKRWVKDPLALSKLHFFNSVAKQLEPFLKMYQTDQPMLPFMVTDLERMIRGLMTRFIKKDIMDNATSVLKLLSIDVKDPSQCTSYKKIEIGFQAETEINKKLKTKDALSDRKIMDFRMECKEILSSIVAKLLIKNPLQFSLVRNLKCLNPKFMATNSENSTRCFKNVCSTLVEAKRLNPGDVDTLLFQFKEFTSNIASVNSSFTNYDGHGELRLDQLFYEHLSVHDAYKKLWWVVKSLLLLSHGQATVERGFSINKELIVENLKENSLIAQRGICDYLSYVGGIEKVVISKSLLQSVSAARQRYMKYLDDRSKEKAQTSGSEKRKRLQEELQGIKKKKKMCIENEVTELLKSADDLAAKAEKERNFGFIIKSNSFRKSASDKQDEIKNLEKELSAKIALLSEAA